MGQPKAAPFPLGRRVSARPASSRAGLVASSDQVEHANLAILSLDSESWTQILCVMRLKKTSKRDCHWLISKKERDWRVEERLEPKKAENEHKSLPVICETLRLLKTSSKR